MCRRPAEDLLLAAPKSTACGNGGYCLGARIRRFPAGTAQRFRRCLDSDGTPVSVRMASWTLLRLRLTAEIGARVSRLLRSPLPLLGDPLDRRHAAIGHLAGELDLAARDLSLVVQLDLLIAEFRRDGEI